MQIEQLSAIKKSELNNNPIVLAIDAGGTYLKSALVDGRGVILNDRVIHRPVNSQGNRESIISTFVETIEDALATCESESRSLAAIGVGIPGPFDYDNARPLMKHKFQSIYGINLREAIFERLDISEPLPMMFESDAHSFLRGEAWLGSGQGYNRIVAVTIGTGLGIGFMESSQILHNGRGGPYRTIFMLPCQNGILEDYVSKRGITRIYQSLSHQKESEAIEVREIARLGIEEKNPYSLQTFQEIGQILGQNIKPLLIELQADCLILGGQISKSFVLFTESICSELDSVNSLKKITAGRNIDIAALQGAARFAFSKCPNK